MERFDKFNYIEVLDLHYSGDTSSSTAEIFANGNNQVPVIISVLLRDSDGNPIDLTENDLKDLIYFANPVTGEEISNSQNNFKVSDTPGEFTKAVSYSKNIFNQEKKIDEVYIYKYISSNSPFSTIDFCVGINIPGYGKFDTSNKGTGNKFPNGSQFNSPKSLILKASQAISYSDNENLVIEDNNVDIYDFHNLVTDMRVKTAGSSGGFTGTSSFHCVKIRLKDGLEILKKEVIRNQAKVEDMLNIHGFKQENNGNQGKEVFGEGGSADIILGRCADKDAYSFDTSLVFIDQEVFGIRNTLDDPLVNGENGIRLFNNSSKDVWYTIGGNDKRHVLTAGKDIVPSLSNKYILIVTTNHAVINIKGLSQRRWENSPKDLTTTVKVYDHFGNYGEIKIGLYKNSWPNISVNNQ